MEKINTQEPNFADDLAPEVNQKMRDYWQSKQVEEKAKSSMKKELESIKNYYGYYIEKEQKTQQLLRAEMLNLIDTEHGVTSLSTSMGRITARKDKDKWNWPTGRKEKLLVKKLPAHLVEAETVYKPNKKAIKSATAITDDGKVVIKNTGEVISSLTGHKAKGYGLTIVPNKQMRGEK